LVLANVLTQFTPQDFPDWWHMPLWFLGFTVAALMFSGLTSLWIKREVRGVYIMSLLFQNGTFFPLIILSGMFGATNNYLVLLFLFIFIQPSLIFSTYPFFFKKQPQAANLSLIRILNPVLIMTVFGLIIGLVNIATYIPDFIILILTMVGAMAIPLFMLILGGNIYSDFMVHTSGRQKISWNEVIKFTAAKNLVFPLVILGILIWWQPDFEVALILILEAAVPPITAIPIFAERCGGNRALANQFILASFIFSIISIPAMIYLFSRFFPFPS
jgi:predicted permease